MIDISEVRQIQRAKITAQFQAHMDALEREIDDQKQLFAKQETAKDSAEQMFPEVLQTIEDRIRRTIKGGVSNTIQYIIDDSAKDTFLIALIVPALTLKGFICRLRVGSNKLEVSW